MNRVDRDLDRAIFRFLAIVAMIVTTWYLVAALIEGQAKQDEHDRLVHPKRIDASKTDQSTAGR